MDWLVLAMNVARDAEMVLMNRTNTPYEADYACSGYKKLNSYTNLICGKQGHITWLG